jgi:hypothetical protein
MVQGLTSLPVNWSNRILCYYENSTSQMQLARIANIPDWLFERVVFPGQRVLFEALPDSLLDIYVCTPNMTLLERIPCPRLLVKEIIHQAAEMVVYTDSIDIAE